MEFYKNKVCIVTGAASGIGKAVAELLLSFGAIVILIDKNEELLLQQTQLGMQAKLKICDVTDAKQVNEVVDYVLNEYGRIDYVFNNAGITILGEVRDIGLEDWNKVLSVDINGVVNGVMAAYPIMVKQGFGHIVNTSSMAGFVPIVIEAPYVAAKYAVVGLSHSLRMEGKKLGVKVSVVCPGGVNTPIMLNSKIIGSQAQQPIDLLKAMPWFPKLITPEKAAKIILKGVAKNKATILTNFSSRLCWYCYRLWPNLWMWFYEAYTMKKFRAMRVEIK